MKIRVRKGFIIKSVVVDSIITCYNNALATKYNSNIEKFEYYKRDAGQLFFSQCKDRMQEKKPISSYIRY